MVNGKPLEEELERINNFFDNLSEEEFKNVLVENGLELNEEDTDN